MDNKKWSGYYRYQTNQNDWYSKYMQAFANPRQNIDFALYLLEST